MELYKIELDNNTYNDLVRWYCIIFENKNKYPMKIGDIVLLRNTGINNEEKLCKITSIRNHPGLKQDFIQLFLNPIEIN